MIQDFFRDQYLCVICNRNLLIKVPIYDTGKVLKSECWGKGEGHRQMLFLLNAYFIHILTKKDSKLAILGQQKSLMPVVLRVFLINNVRAIVATEMHKNHTEWESGTCLPVEP